MSHVGASHRQCRGIDIPQREQDKSEGAEKQAVYINNTSFNENEANNRD